MVGISFAWEAHTAFFIELPHEYGEAFLIVQEFKELFENPKTLKIGQNIKFDIGILKWYEISVAGPLFDTLLAHYLLQPDLRHNMNYLAESYLQYSPVSIEELIGKRPFSENEPLVELIEEPVVEPAVEPKAAPTVEELKY